MKLTKEELEQIKEYLYHGELGKLADEYGISRSHAYHVLNGSANSPGFLKAAQLLALKNKAEHEERIAKLKEKVQ